MSRRRSSLERSSPKLTAEQIRQFHSLGIPREVVPAFGSSAAGVSDSDASFSDGAPRRFGFLSKLNAFGMSMLSKVFIFFQIIYLSIIFEYISSLKSLFPTNIDAFPFKYSYVLFWP